jgi:hypothetical protein
MQGDKFDCKKFNDLFSSGLSRCPISYYTVDPSTQQDVFLSFKPCPTSSPNKSLCIELSGSVLEGIGGYRVYQAKYYPPAILNHSIDQNCNLTSTNGCVAVQNPTDCYLPVNLSELAKYENSNPPVKAKEFYDSDVQAAFATYYQDLAKDLEGDV